MLFLLYLMLFKMNYIIVLLILVIFPFINGEQITIEKECSTLKLCPFKCKFI